MDLSALMERLGAAEVDSVLLEGGGTLNWTALESGIVQRVQAYIAPKLFGGAAAKSPVEGLGVELPAQAVRLKKLPSPRWGWIFYWKARWIRMFTGIVEEMGTIRSIRRGAHSGVLSNGAELVLSDLKIGDSVAVNGVCLTATGKDSRGFTADVMHETLNRSSLGALVPGSRVNLERAMAADGRFGGHIVSGHIDGTGTIAALRKDDDAVWYTIQSASSLLRYIVEKGSVTIDGISLTVASVESDRFSVSIIPHTAAVTILGQKRAGDIVNLETDIIGKYVEKLLRPRAEQPRSGGISLEFLVSNGF